jgi:hypothetical protein
VLLPRLCCCRILCVRHGLPRPPPVQFFHPGS